MKRTLLSLLLCVLCVSPISWGAQGKGANQDFTLTTMTRNMYPGADLGAALTADPEDPAAFLAAVESIANDVIGSRIPERAVLIAAEIAAKKPDLVALQEATKWKIKSQRGMIVLDQLELLISALQRGGQHYRVAVAQKLTDVQIKGMISYADHDAILVRTDRPLNVVGTETHLFDKDSLLTFSFMGGDLQVLRGWIAVDAKIHGSRFKFVNTHLESPLPEPPEVLQWTQYLQFLQAQQLASELSAFFVPIILAGDFNSNAEPYPPGYPPDQTPSYSLLVYGGGGFVDAWHILNPTDSGYTWPVFGFPEYSERIDLILSKGLSVSSMETIGTDPVNGLYASDHAGVVAVFQLPNPR